MGEPHIRVTGIGEGATSAPLGEGNEYAQSVEQRFLEHFGLSEQPFGVTPDPRFLYLGPKHRQALAALNYGTESNRGFLTLIAQPGMGKTSLLFNYLEGLRNKARTVFLFHTDCDSRELMSYILADLGLDGTGKDLPEMHSILNQVLTEEMRLGRRFVLVIDEAQNLTERVLESVRLLSNFETPWMKLMQIVLAGQPQLAERLAKPSMAQLRQRISFEIQIESLTSEEVNLYVDHRLWVAGYKGTSLFSIGARTLLAEHSEGIPRNINNMCFCAMSLAWATKQKTIDREMMRDLLAEMNPGSMKAKTEITPKSVDPPKQSVVQNLRPAVLTVKAPPARGWLPKVVLASAVLFALGWSGMHFDVGKRFTTLWHGTSAAEKNSVVPTPAPVSLDPAAQTGRGNVSPGLSPEAPTDEKNPGVPQQSGVESTLSNREPN
jgi:type II secretory pathway predicted ATPase ExeA